MRSLFYPKLAVQNIGKNRRFYFPYLLTCIFTICMFYNLSFIKNNPGISEMRGGASIKSVLEVGAVVVGIFSAIFLFYTNSFLIKHRKKEFGLYNILGMSKRNIAYVLFFETLITAAATLIIGLLTGIALSKFLLLIMFKIVKFSVPLGFSVSVTSINLSVCLFLAIFLVNLFYNLGCIKLSNPIELLHGGNVGEKEPKAKWFIATLGVLCLAAGYIIALITESPLDALPLFMVAVILVIFGTYLLFIAGSITVLKLMRNKKSFYYKAKHFTSISGMLYRMKQNAAGLASICILSTMVLVLISTTVCMYKGVENALDNRFPNDISFSLEYSNTSKTPEEIKTAVSAEAEKSNLQIKNAFDYTYLSFTAASEDNSFNFSSSNYIASSKQNLICVVTADEYKRITGNDIKLSENEIALFSIKNKYNWDSIKFEDNEYKVTKWLDSFPAKDVYSAYLNEAFYFVVSNDTVLNVFNDKQQAAYGDHASGIEWYMSFDLDGTEEEIKECYNNMVAATSEERTRQVTLESGEMVEQTYNVSYSSCRQEASEDFYGMYGGLLFIGLFLGVLFLGATVLIIYYKQISEGYDDRERFVIMQKVGMSRAEVKRSVNSQVLTVFFLPIIAAVIHLLFAFKMITKLLSLFNLTDIPLFAICAVITVIVFAAVYAIIYALTARTYYKIVEA